MPQRSGMSTFSTRGGLYEKAQKKFKLSDGKMLFTYTFFDRRRLEAQVRRSSSRWQLPRFVLLLRM